MSITQFLTVSTGGRWCVTTQTGSTYILDLTNMTVERSEYAHELRRDDEVLPLKLLEPVHVGQPMRMVIDVVNDGATRHVTNHITRHRNLGDMT